MQLTKRNINAILAIAFLATLLVPLTSLRQLASAAADTCTWTGGGADNNLSTTGNWTGCDNSNIPENGDILAFPADTIVTVTNDTGVDVAGVTIADSTSASSVTLAGDFSLMGTLNVGEDNTLNFTGNVSAIGDIVTAQDYTISGETIVGVGDIDFSGGTLNMAGNDLTISTTGYTPIDVESIASGYDIYVPDFTVSTLTTSGAVNASGVRLHFVSSGGANTISSTITLNDSVLQFTNANQLGSANIISNDSSLYVSDTLSTADKNIPNDITFNGNLYGATFAIGASYAGLETVGTFNTEFSGAVVLQKDLAIQSGALSVPTIDFLFSGSLSGDGLIGFRSVGLTKPLLKITASTNSTSIPSGTFQVVNGTQSLSDDDPTTNIIILPISTITVTGTRGDVVVSSGGRLEGTGTVASLLVQSTAEVAPGLSPGCLSTGNLTINGAYEFEIDGSTVCTQYDQIDVTGSVTLTGGTLDLLRDSAYLPALNTEFVLINNDAADTVTGEFSGWAQGAQVVVDGVTYEIDYAGGDGNDVVLTVVAIDSTVAEAAAAPDTGLPSILSNPFVGLIALIASATTLVILRRKQLI